MKKYIILLLTVMTLNSCDYLDIVPDERTTEENTYQNRSATLDFLYSCYGFQPLYRDILTNAYHQMGGETTYHRAEAFSIFYEGSWGPSAPGMTSETWGPIWDGIRKCHLFLSIIDKANVSPTEREIFKAEATFMLAFYHFLSLRSYGPTIIIDRLFPQDMKLSDFPERSSVEEVVSFIDSKIQEAIDTGLAETHVGNDLGRATLYTAYALRSRLYLYNASPLFNGQDDSHSNMYADFKSLIDGRPLISSSRSVEKWQKAADASLEAITILEAAGFHLYGDAEAGTPSSTKPSVSEPAQRRVRYSVVDYPGNVCEVIWSDTRQENMYGLQRRSMIKQPRRSGEPHAYDIQGTIVPTLQSVESFYTKNGLPMDKDQDFDHNGRFGVVTIPANYDGNNYSGGSINTTCKMHLDREPRFYANVGFHGGYIEIVTYDGAVTSSNDANKVVQLQIRNSDAHGRKGASTNYSMSGYNNKKLCHPAYSNGWERFPLPLFRLAEIYLNYAEALIELGGADNLTKAKVYIDKVRTRAGIPTVDEAWNRYSTDPGYQNTQEGLRQIVRRERMLELYLEGHKFFDVRRWMEAEKHYGILDRGLNTIGDTDEEFFRPVDLDFLPRSFHKGQYLMPIPSSEINKVPQIIQNPYYE